MLLLGLCSGVVLHMWCLFVGGCRVPIVRLQGCSGGIAPPVVGWGRCSWLLLCCLLCFCPVFAGFWDVVPYGDQCLLCCCWFGCSCVQVPGLAFGDAEYLRECLYGGGCGGSGGKMDLDEFSGCHFRCLQGLVCRFWYAFRCGRCVLAA